jgi:hypothetical protein
LCGCLAAAQGHAFVFIEADDPPDEQRFTLAHELAHFLRDVWRPRRRVERILGPARVDVYDARRPATPEERLAAALEEVDLAVRVHLLPRDAEGRPATEAGAEAEDAADVPAIELLAPAVHLAQAGAAAWPARELIERLTSAYGLPRREAERYVERLRPPAPRPDEWLQALRASL